MGKFRPNRSNLKLIPTKTKPTLKPSSKFLELTKRLSLVDTVTDMQKISRNVDESVAYIKIWVEEGRGVGEVGWGKALS
ncbi:MAG: hypothetical protein CK551_02030 [Planctomycetaceae bacterium]|nr:MAG: hypothetical protein CK551_02030 [Planctomycetaceae bacterium]